MPKEKLAVIIPTKDRSDELSRLLANLVSHSDLIEQIIVVDGSANPVRELCENFSHFKINYLRKTPASLTTQRNIGIRALREDITLVAFFDDDVVFEEDAIKNMMRFWDAASIDVGGAGFNVTNVLYTEPTIFERIFFVNAEMPCTVLRSGFQSKYSCMAKTSPVGWLPGCAMVWRKSIFKDFMFDEWFSGYARYEEVEFSYRVAKVYKMFVVADAKAQHPVKVEDIGFSFSLGEMESINRLYFVRKNPELSLALCVWGLAGIFLNNISKAALKMNVRYLYRAQGNLSGFVKDLLNFKS